MSEKPRPPIKTCPVCRIAMLASKSDESLPHYDTFNCPSCRSVISYAPRRNEPKREP